MRLSLLIVSASFDLRLTTQVRLSLLLLLLYRNWMVELIAKVFLFDAMMLTLIVMLHPAMTLAVRLLLMALMIAIAMTMYLSPRWLQVVSNKLAMFLVVIFDFVFEFCKYFCACSLSFLVARPQRASVKMIQVGRVT